MLKFAEPCEVVYRVAIEPGSMTTAQVKRLFKSLREDSDDPKVVDADPAEYIAQGEVFYLRVVDDQASAQWAADYLGGHIARATAP